MNQLISQWLFQMRKLCSNTSFSVNQLLGPSVINDGEEQPKCICINPGRLARGEGGGFFAEINYKGNPHSSSASIVRI